MRYANRRGWGLPTGLLAALSILAVAAPSAARAQLLGQYYPSGIPGYQSWASDAVLERPHSEYDPLGVRAGSFVIRPSLSESLGYDSNVAGLPQPVGSALAETQGSVAVGSDWARNQVAATLSFDNVHYLQQPNLSHTDWTAAVGGALDIGQDRATLAYSHVTATTVPYQIGTVGVGQPVTFTIDSVRASYTATLGRFTLVPEIDAAVYRYSNVLSFGLNEATNDLDTINGSLTAGYELAPGSSLVLVASGGNGAYITRLPGIPTADYNDVSLVGGIDVRTGALFRYRATIGYEVRRYVNPQIPATAAPLAEFDMIWTPTRLTTVTGQLARSLQNAITPGVIGSGAESYAYTNARLEVDHEARRNVQLQAFGQLQNADYQMHGGTQRVMSAGASVTWLLNRKLSLTGSYTYTQSTVSLGPGQNVTDNLAQLTLSFHL